MAENVEYETQWPALTIISSILIWKMWKLFGQISQMQHSFSFIWSHVDDQMTEEQKYIFSVTVTSHVEPFPLLISNNSFKSIMHCCIDALHGSLAVIFSMCHINNSCNIYWSCHCFTFRLMKKNVCETLSKILSCLVIYLTYSDTQQTPKQWRRISSSITTC